MNYLLQGKVVDKFVIAFISLIGSTTAASKKNMIIAGLVGVGRFENIRLTYCSFSVTIKLLAVL